MMKTTEKSTWQQLLGMESSAPLAWQLGQIVFVRKLMLVFIPLLIAFAWYNMQNNHLQLAIVEFAMVGVLLVSVTWLFKRCAFVLPWVAALVIFVLGCMVFMDGGIGNMGFLWMMMVPFFFFSVLGQRWGWLLSLLYVGQIMVIQSVMTAAFPYTASQVCVFLLAYSMQTLLAAAATLLRSDYHQLTIQEADQCQHIQTMQQQVGREAATWQTTMDCMDDAMLILDGQGHIARKNRAATQLDLAYPAMEVAQLCKQLFNEQAVVTGDVREHTEQEIFVASIERWFAVSVYPLHYGVDADVGADAALDAEIHAQVATGVLVMLKDVSAQHAEQALAAQELYLLHNMQRVNQVVAEAQDSPAMMKQLMAVLRDIFGADRASLWTADVPDWLNCRVAVQSSSEQCVALPCQVLMEKDREMQQMFAAALASNTTMTVLPQMLRQQHAVSSQMLVAVRSQHEQPWLLLVQQCAQDRLWDEQQRNLLNMIAERLVNVLDAWQLHESLERRTDQFLQLVENMPDAIIILMDKTIIFANEVMCHLVGEELVDDCLGKRLHDYIHPDYQLLSQQRFALALEGKRNPIQEMKLVDKYGNLVDVVTSSMAVSYHGKAAVQIIMRDVTKRNQMDRALKDSLLRNKQLARQLINIQEQERVMIAQNLHDDSGQLLTALSINLQSLKKHATAAKAQALLEDNEAILQQLFTSMRASLETLNPTHIDVLGLSNAIRSDVEVWAQRFSMKVNIDISSGVDFPCPETATAIFRVIQEALTNIAKHAHASQVWLRLQLVRQQTTYLTLEIRDNGCGFVVKQAHGKGFGLLGMRSRAELVSGVMVMESELGVGTTIVVDFPVHPAEILDV